MSKTIVRYENDYEIQYILDQHKLTMINKDNPQKVVEAIDKVIYEELQSFGYGIICTKGD